MQHHRCALGHNPETRWHSRLTLSQLNVSSVMYTIWNFIKFITLLRYKSSGMWQHVNQWSVLDIFKCSPSRSSSLSGDVTLKAIHYDRSRPKELERYAMATWTNRSLSLMCLCTLSYHIIAARRGMTNNKHLVERVDRNCGFITCYIPQHRWRKSACQQGWTPSPPSWTPAVPLNGCPEQG
jgi:hypothetical protein